MLKKLGKLQQAKEQFVRAVEEFRLELTLNPKSEVLCIRLGDALASLGDFAGASQYFREALDLNPANALYYDNLARALEHQGYNDEAVQVLKDGIQFMSDNRLKENAIELQKYLEQIQSQRTNRKE